MRVPYEVMEMIVARCDPETAVALRWTCTDLFVITALHGVYSFRNHLNATPEKGASYKMCQILEAFLLSSDSWDRRLEQHEDLFAGCVSLRSLTLILQNAVIMGRLRSVVALMESASIDTAAPLYPCYTEALSLPTTATPSLLAVAGMLGKVDVVRVLLRYPLASTVEAIHKSMMMAAAEGATEIVRLLLAHPRSGQALKGSWPLVLAAERGHIDTLRMLLHDSRCDPAVDSNTALRVAAINGHAKAVALLISDVRVNPVACGDEPIRMAAQNGHAEVVRLLLSDKRVNANSGNTRDFLVACNQGHVDTARALLCDRRDTVQSGVLTTALSRASLQNHPSIVRLLLADGRVDLSLNNHAPFFDAARLGHSQIVRLLISDPSLTANDRREALRLATQNKHTDTIALLSSPPMYKA